MNLSTPCTLPGRCLTKVLTRSPLLPYDTCLFPSPAFHGSLPPWSPPLAPAYLSSSCWGSCQLPHSTSATSESPMIEPATQHPQFLFCPAHAQEAFIRPLAASHTIPAPRTTTAWWLKPGWELKPVLPLPLPLLLLTLVLPFFLLSPPGSSLSRHSSHVSPLSLAHSGFFPCSLIIKFPLLLHSLSPLLGATD